MTTKDQSRDFVERYLSDECVVFRLRDQENLERALEDFLDEIEAENQEALSDIQNDLDEANKEKEEIERDLHLAQRDLAEAIVLAEKAEKRLNKFVDTTA